MNKMPLSEITFTVVDTETTGFSPKSARLVEIAAVKVRPGLAIDTEDTFAHLVNPGCKIGYDTFKIHGISNEMVADKPLIGEIIQKFINYSHNTVLVAHNAKFDMSFINAAIEENGLTATHIGVIDTVSLARKAFPGCDSYKLDAMIELLNLQTFTDDSHRHRALFDASHTANLLIKCIKTLSMKGIDDFFDL